MATSSSTTPQPTLAHISWLVTACRTQAVHSKRYLIGSQQMKTPRTFLPKQGFSHSARYRSELHKFHWLRAKPLPSCATFTWQTTACPPASGPPRHRVLIDRVVPLVPLSTCSLTIERACFCFCGEVLPVAKSNIKLWKSRIYLYPAMKVQTRSV